jgi:hypothetical protein
MRRRRFKTWAKWACTAAAAMTVGLAAVSGLYPNVVVFISSDGTVDWTVSATEGMLILDMWHGAPGQNAALRPGRAHGGLFQRRCRRSR